MPSCFNLHHFAHFSPQVSLTSMELLKNIAVAGGASSLQSVELQVSLEEMMELWWRLGLQKVFTCPVCGSKFYEHCRFWVFNEQVISEQSQLIAGAELVLGIYCIVELCFALNTVICRFMFLYFGITRTI